MFVHIFCKCSASMHWGGRGILPAHIFSKIALGRRGILPAHFLARLYWGGRGILPAHVFSKIALGRAWHIISLLSFNFTEEHTISRSKQHISTEASNTFQLKSAAKTTRRSHPAQKAWRRPLMVRQPYSVAV